ncbi:MAG: T9SS type A sorting domain-containing protein [Rhodothermales bacterium]|nr:T9SS type A sorting domain-containing protein [Rhodothermales bacterium]
MHVRVEVFDALGRRVALLHDGPTPALGVGFDLSGRPAGLYFVRVTGEGVTTTRRVTLLR